MTTANDVRARAFADHATDGEVALELDRVYDTGNSPWGVPAYRFHILYGGERAGTVSLRIGRSELVLRYAGHVGFGVDPRFRGRALAERAVRLILPLAATHGLSPLWITCNPANLASRRVLERLGAEYVETVSLPADYDTYAEGEREKCRFRLEH